VAQAIPDPGATRVLALSAFALVPDGQPNRVRLWLPPAPPQFETRAGSALLKTLYASTAVTQALEVHSSILALDGGAVEANPLMRRLSNNRPAFIATKAVATTFAAREVSKRSELAAVILLVAVNPAVGWAAMHNYSVARGQR
jgi:hypothetical protein